MKAILTYHSIDRSGSVVSVAPETFRQHVRWLVERSIRVVRLRELLRLDGDEDALALTFDDGFANFTDQAWPLLREHGLPVTLFVASDWVGRSNAWGGWAGVDVPELPLLDWEALGRMAEEGVEIGSHSRTHADLRKVDAARLDDELAGSAERIRERTGHTPRALAYPYGTYDARVVRAARTLYDVAVTTELREVRPEDDPHALPRLDVYYLRRAGRLERWGTRSFRRYLTLRRQLRSARRLLMKGADS